MSGPRAGDGWTVCSLGHRHWGLHGAAGLLLVRRTGDGHPDSVVLQHRATWSDHGDTWGIPGGAREPQETAAQAALREAGEEAGIPADAARVTGEHLLDHGTWTYTTVLAEATAPVDVRATDPESQDVRWVPVDAVAGLDLHPGFADAWPGLRRRLERG